MRQRRDFGDAGYLDAYRIERPHGGLAARTRPLDTHFEIFHATFLRCFASLFGGNLSGEGRALARSLEALAARSRPRQRIALPIGDGDDRVVEGGVNVRDSVGD